MEPGAQPWPQGWPLRLGLGIVARVGVAVVVPVGVAVAVSIAVRVGVAIRMLVGVGVVATCSSGRRGAGGADASLMERVRIEPLALVQAQQRPICNEGPCSSMVTARYADHVVIVTPQY